MRIFLVGYMGSGKTHIGKKLAEKLSVDFFDLDEYIETRENASISQIFHSCGENYFREMEREALRRLFLAPEAVVATGGGAPCFFDNMEQMNRYGKTIYLKTSEAILWNRLKNQLVKRPLLADKSPVEIQRFIQEQIAARAPYYEKANYMIDHIQNDDQIIEELVKWLNPAVIK